MIQVAGLQFVQLLAIVVLAMSPSDLFMGYPVVFVVLAAALLAALVAVVAAVSTGSDPEDSLPVGFVVFVVVAIVGMWMASNA